MCFDVLGGGSLRMNVSLPLIAIEILCLWDIFTCLIGLVY